MSLNGLEDPKVREAHEGAAAEPGGWFLLKYASRDKVELLGRGNGGIVEVRNAVAEYEETSPLYGFLRYRRRNVLIKYLPEDCSRLIQARVAVHLNAVCELFSPYDTIFEISDAKELKDTKLSAACSLHAASASSSSSTSSLRRRRLMEIAEEEEEEQRAPKRQSIVNEDDEGPKISAEPTSPTVPVTLNAELAASPEHSKFSAGETSELPNFVGADERPLSPVDSINAARRMSSQSSRPDYYSYSTYPYGKPKVKLAPRPSLDVNGKAHTAASYRPVSQIPAGFKFFGKGSKKGKEKDDDNDPSSPQEELPEINFTAFVPIPEESQRPDELQRPKTSSGVSTKSATMPPSAKPTMTREKARLMKAMKLREQKKQMNIHPPPLSPAAVDAPSHDVEEDEETEDKAGAKEDATAETEKERKLSVSNADSAIALDASCSSVNTDQASELTQTDSRPTSPVVASSEADRSTKASSLSESTDETVHDKGEDVDEKDDGHESADEEAKPVDKDQVEEEKIPTVADEGSANADADPAIKELVQENKVEEEPVGVVEEAGPTRDPETSSSAEKATTEMSDAQPAAQETRDAAAVPFLGSATGTVCIPAESESAQNPTPKSSVEAAETAGIPTASEKEAEVAIATRKDEEPPTPTSPRLKIPKSKFSTQDLRSAAAKTAALPTIETPGEQTVPEEAPAVVSDEVAAKNKVNDKKPDNEADNSHAESKPTKRKVLVEPIRTDLAQSRRASRSDANLSDNDDELLEELHSATVQEAKPMLVAKSPATPVFPSPTKLRPTTSNDTPHTVRTVSNPVRGTLMVPTDVSQSSARSLSSGAAYLHQVTQQSSGAGNLAKKSNIGSSISQRIKALEKLSSKPGEALSPGPVVRDRPSSAFFSVKKSREPSRSSSVVERANSFNRHAPSSRSGSQDESLETSRPPRRDRSGSVASRLSMFETPGESLPLGHTPRGRPESISVTAKIIRDPDQNMQKTLEPPKDPSEYSHLELKQSPLLVDHQRRSPASEFPGTLSVGSPKESPMERRMSKEEDSGRRSSFSIVKDFIKERRRSVASNSSEAVAPPPSAGSSRSPTRPPSAHNKRLSISSRRSSFGRDSAVSPSAVTEGSASGDETKSNSDKKTSRAGRFMRRLSNLSSGGSRGKITSPTGISPTVKEEEAPEVRPATTNSSPSIVAYLGDVNVQFPDTLLWKRRNMCLDSQGFLILSSLPGQSGRAAQGTKRYHLSEFRAPYIPDVEVQELPNSVVLDFVEGSGVQVACEDRAGQMNVLQVLQDAHAVQASRFGP